MVVLVTQPQYVCDDDDVYHMKLRLSLIQAVTYSVPYTHKVYFSHQVKVTIVLWACLPAVPCMKVRWYTHSFDRNFMCLFSVSPCCQTTVGGFIHEQIHFDFILEFYYQCFRWLFSIRFLPIKILFVFLVPLFCAVCPFQSKPHNLTTVIVYSCT
jgi:hypothetical protein